MQQHLIHCQNRLKRLLREGLTDDEIHRAVPQIPLRGRCEVVADDMGYGDVGIYGNEYIKTPNIDQMAREGMMFTDFHSNGSVSSPTRCGLLTGRYQQRAGLEKVLLVPRDDKDKEVGLQSEEITFAKILGDNGYRTALIGKWHLG